MRHFGKALVPLLLLAMAGLLCAGCASSNVNPDHAAHKMGYVDFYCRDSSNLCWEVVQVHGQSGKTVYSEFDPPEGGMVRLAYKPGAYQFQVSFLNRVITDPGSVQVEVKDGQITPVRTDLVPVGTMSVQNRETMVGGTYFGRYGRTTKYSNDQSRSYSVRLTSQDTLPYAPKEHMAYAPGQ